ncbi:MAG: hypothetical protein EOP45_11445 [Sphingobacteriaceae bacterium]|nr:MAG: hypothetical protein EOP45_11445 [Sphingobacteriaceae bacterium]
MSETSSTTRSEEITSANEVRHIWKSKIDYHMQKGLFFGIRNFIGKVCLQSRMYDAFNHPARLESKVMQHICIDRSKEKQTVKKKHQRFLPVLFYHKAMSIVDPLLYPLPMRSFGTTIHPQCDIIVVPRYATTFYDLRESNTLDLDNYRSILFRILYALYFLQKQYGFMHNDLHIQNILMKASNPGNKLVNRDYIVNGVKYQVPDLDWIPIMWDFEDARCHKIPELAHNLKTDNAPDVPPMWCPYYDVHFLLISVIDVFADSNDGIIPLEVRQWVLSMFPEEAIPPRVRDDSELPSVNERREQLARYESKEYIERLLIGQTLPDDLHTDLHAYWEQTWSDDDDDEIDQDSDDEETDDDPENFYGKGDNYYDYLKSELPRNGITWDEEVHELCIQAKQDVTMTEPSGTYDNRLTNTFEKRDSLPTVEQLLQSEFFSIYRV